MLRHPKALIVTTLALGTFGLAGASPSASASGVAALAGGGTISPGLSTTAANQSFTFSGTLAYAGSPGAGTYTCNVSGSSSGPETVATGAGSASGGCSGSAGSFSFSGAYTRAGGAVTVTGHATGSAGSGSVTCALGFAATSAPTVTSYQVAGSCVLV